MEDMPKFKQDKNYIQPGAPKSPNNFVPEATFGKVKLDVDLSDYEFNSSVDNGENLETRLGNTLDFNNEEEKKVELFLHR